MMRRRASPILYHPPNVQLQCIVDGSSSKTPAQGAFLELSWLVQYISNLASRSVVAPGKRKQPASLFLLCMISRQPSGPQPSAAPSTGYPLPTKTPIRLYNNDRPVNDGNQRTIFSTEPVQMLLLPSRGGHYLQDHGQPPSPPVMPRGSVMPRGVPTRSELLFGTNSDSAQTLETATQELSRLQIVTMRQLQRALQNKITQNTRNPMGVWSAFHKLDRRGVQHLNLADLIAAVRGFNLVASDELVTQLLHALDRDHGTSSCRAHMPGRMLRMNGRHVESCLPLRASLWPCRFLSISSDRCAAISATLSTLPADGVLSLQEFVAGLKSDTPLQLQQPQHGVSSRRYFAKVLKYNHPLHNVAHLSSLHQFEENPLT